MASGMPFEGGQRDDKKYIQDDVKLNFMTRNKLFSYNPNLKKFARELRLNSTMAGIILWKNIKNKALGYEFHRQVPIYEYIVDFFCHELKLVIEVDGYTHNYKFKSDKLRQNKLESLGLKVIRFTDEDVKKHMNDVIGSIEATIIEIVKDKL